MVLQVPATADVDFFVDAAVPEKLVKEGLAVQKVDDFGEEMIVLNAEKGETGGICAFEVKMYCRVGQWNWICYQESQWSCEAES